MKNKKPYISKNLKTFARKLRNHSTDGEIILWSKVLRARKLGYQFNRQFPMRLDELNMIVDFICRKLKLVIEVDGYSHNFKIEEDDYRDDLLKKNGYTVLRITENDVLHDLNNVIRVIKNLVHELETTNSKLPPLRKWGQED